MGLTLVTVWIIRVYVLSAPDPPSKGVGFRVVDDNDLKP